MCVCVVSNSQVFQSTHSVSKDYCTNIQHGWLYPALDPAQSSTRMARSRHSQLTFCCKTQDLQGTRVGHVGHVCV